MKYELSKKNDGIYDAYLAHHGILGMHWGIRRYQNKDGSLTPAGRARLANAKEGKYAKEAYDLHKKMVENELKKKTGSTEWTGDGTEMVNTIGEEQYSKLWNKYLDNLSEAKIKDLKLSVSVDAKKYVDSLLEDQRIKKVHFIDGNGKETVEYIDNATMKDQEFRERTRGFLKYDESIDGKANNKASSEPYKQAAAIRRDKNEIKKQVMDELSSDLKRWQKQGDSYLKGKDVDKISKSIEKELAKRLEEMTDYEIYYNPNKDNRYSTNEINFTINGFKEYSDYAPLTVTYDPINKKVKRIDYL